MERKSAKVLFFYAAETLILCGFPLFLFQKKIVDFVV